MFFEKSFTAKPGRELQAALDNAKSVLDRRHQIENAIDMAIRQQPAVEAALQTAMEELGAFEADVILSGSAVEPGVAHANLTNARDRLDSLIARIQGLHRRLGESEQDVFDAQAVLTPLFDEFAKRCIEEFKAHYLKEAERFHEALHGALGLSTGLGVNIGSLAETAIHGFDTMYPIGPRAEERAQTPAFITTASSVSQPRETLNAIRRSAKEIEQRRGAAAAAAQLRQRSLRPQYSSAAIPLVDCSDPKREAEAAFFTNRGSMAEALRRV